MVTSADTELIVPSHDERDDPTIEYPCEDGEPLAETDAQFNPLTYAVSALRIHFANRQDVYVGGNMLLYYVLNDPYTSVAPDVFAVFGASGNHPRRSWVVSREGGSVPAFVLEIASESTWRHDSTGKREIYAAMGVQEYWRFDPERAYFPVPLVGERLVNGVYEPIEVHADANADVVLRGHSEALGLDICVRSDFDLRLYDPLRGEWLRSHRESEAERLAAEAERFAAESARLAAEERVRQLEAQMRLHGITPEE